MSLVTVVLPRIYVRTPFLVVLHSIVVVAIDCWPLVRLPVMDYSLLEMAMAGN